jgi:hypothetical protein
MCSIKPPGFKCLLHVRRGPKIANKVYSLLKCLFVDLVPIRYATEKTADMYKVEV